jgi:hypothetical protein
MVASETDGVWAQISGLTLPTGATTTAGAQDAGLDDVACTSVGNCVAVGYYTNHGGDYAPMVATETGGVWGKASALTLPPDATSDGAVDGVACTSVGNCVAVGSYKAVSGVQALVASEADGVWGPASTLTLPTGATAPGSQQTVLNGVACTSVGNCVAVGSYDDNSNGANTRPDRVIVASETKGAWGRAKALTLPTGATASTDAVLDGVACTSVGNCVAVGAYYDRSGVGDDGNDRVMVASETDGVWGQASALTLPADAATALDSQKAGLSGVACTSVESCAAVGYYTNRRGHYRAMVVSSTGSSSSSEASPTVVQVETRADGTVGLLVKTAGPWNIDVLETAWIDNTADAHVGHRATANARLKPAGGRFVVARTSASVSGAGTRRFSVAPNQRGIQLISYHRYPVTLRLWVSFTAPSGTVHTVGVYGLHVPSNCVTPVTVPPGRTKINCGH